MIIRSVSFWVGLVSVTVLVLVQVSFSNYNRATHWLNGELKKLKYAFLCTLMYNYQIKLWKSCALFSHGLQIITRCLAHEQNLKKVKWTLINFIWLSLDLLYYFGPFPLIKLNKTFCDQKSHIKVWLGMFFYINIFEPFPIVCYDTKT